MPSGESLCCHVMSLMIIDLWGQIIIQSGSTSRRDVPTLAIDFIQVRLHVSRARSDFTQTCSKFNNQDSSNGISTATQWQSQHGLYQQFPTQKPVLRGSIREGAAQLCGLLAGRCIPAMHAWLPKHSKTENKKQQTTTTTTTTYSHLMGPSVIVGSNNVRLVQHAVPVSNNGHLLSG